VKILKEIGEIFKLSFDNSFVKGFVDEINPPKNYQKETYKLIKQIHEDQKREK
jgi:hypothetical protein